MGKLGIKQTMLASFITDMEKGVNSLLQTSIVYLGTYKVLLYNILVIIYTRYKE